MIKSTMGPRQRELLLLGLSEHKQFRKVRCSCARYRQFAAALARRGFMRRLSFSYFELTPEGVAEAIKLKEQAQ